MSSIELNRVTDGNHARIERIRERTIKSVKNPRAILPRKVPVRQESALMLAAAHGEDFYPSRSAASISLTFISRVVAPRSFSSSFMTM